MTTRRAVGNRVCQNDPYRIKSLSGSWRIQLKHLQQTYIMKRNASAVWTGDLKQGKGKLSTSSGVLKETPYSFTTRFGDANGTNPEELIAAAHAGCFTMATAAALGRAGFTPGRLATEATLTLEQVQNNWTI